MGANKWLIALKKPNAIFVNTFKETFTRFYRCHNKTIVSVNKMKWFIDHNSSEKFKSYDKTGAKNKITTQIERMKIGSTMNHHWWWDRKNYTNKSRFYALTNRKCVRSMTLNRSTSWLHNNKPNGIIMLCASGELQWLET